MNATKDDQMSHLLNAVVLILKLVGRVVLCVSSVIKQVLSEVQYYILIIVMTLPRPVCLLLYFSVINCLICPDLSCPSFLVLN